MIGYQGSQYCVEISMHPLHLSVTLQVVTRGVGYTDP